VAGGIGIDQVLGDEGIGYNYDNPICTGEKTLTRLHYLEAARYFQEAADRVPTGHPDEKGQFPFAKAGGGREVMNAARPAVQDCWP
jgi:hypothetical protein